MHASAPDSSADRLLHLARPGLEAGDAARVASEVSTGFSVAALLFLLHTPLDAMTRSLVALSLGFTGRGPVVEAALDRLLRDAAPAVVDAAEHALWTLWLRGNGGPGLPAFERGLSAVAEGDEVAAEACFLEAVRRDGGFAEAHHQLGLLASVRGRLGEAADRYAAAAAARPRHFGALAGSGHTAAQRGRLEEAESWYRDAAAVHPALGGLGEALEAVSAARHRRAG